MQKVVDILEQHVQWIAIGLGGLFVLLMVWWYVITPPAAVEIAGEQLGPGEVDPHTASTVAQELNGAINGGGKIPVTVPSYVNVFKENMAWQNAKPVEFAGPWNSLTKDVEIPVDPNAVPQPGVPGAPGVPGGPGAANVAVADAGKIQALPVLPKAVPGDHKHGRSVVLLPVDGQPVAMPQPGQPDAGVDKDWVTQLFKIDSEALAQAFTAAKITSPPLPPQLAMTLFLQVEMEREELMPDGSWGNRQIVPKLDIFPQNMAPPPFPEPNANRAVQGAYLAWATANTPAILQPPFYTTVPTKGDQWTKPGEQVVVEQIFDPMQWIDARDLSTLTPEQKAEVMRVRRERSKMEQDQKRQQRQPTGPRTPPGGLPPEMEGDVLYAPAPPQAQQQRQFAPAPRPPARPSPYGRPPAGYAPYGGMTPEDMMMMEGDPGMMMEGYGAMPAQQGLPQPGVDYPQGEFNPNDPQAQWRGKQIETWAHDATVEPGKTYRYRIRYKLKNPIFAAGNVATKPELANEFAIVSPDSDWASPVKVPELVNFFIASSNPTAKTVRFDVFTWDQGQTKKEQFVLAPGDLVGGQLNGVDFSTNWTVVDFRHDPRQDDVQIMLVNNEDGSIAVRSYKADSGDALYKALKEQVEAAKLLTTPTAVGAAGMPPLR